MLLKNFVIFTKILFILFNNLKSQEFSLIVIPDSQKLIHHLPQNFYSQMNWIADISDSLNIAYVAHVGDIVEVSNDISEWNIANNGFLIIEETINDKYPQGIPYGIVPGNHDYPTDNLNIYFSPSRFTDRLYFGGSMIEGEIDNNFTLFSNSGRKFIIINLDCWLDSESSFEQKISWSDSLLHLYKDRGAIIVSHDLIIPEYDNIAGEIFNIFGQEVYDSLKHHPNLFMFLTGHRLGEGLLTKTFQGRTVFAMLSNYQGEPYEYGYGGTAGWLRLLNFNLIENYINVRTYSPPIDSFKIDSSSMFTLQMNFDLFVNNRQPDIYLTEDFADTITIDMDSIFRFIGGEITYSSHIIDGSSINANITSDHYLNIYNYFEDIFGESQIIITGSNEFNGHVSDTFSVFKLPINDCPSEPSIISPNNDVELILDVNSNEINNDLTMLWTSSFDVDNDSISYTIKISPVLDSIDINTFFSASTRDTSLSLPYIYILNYFEEMGYHNNLFKIILIAQDYECAVTSSDSIILFFDTILEQVETRFPESFILKQNYPNPFNPSTQISYALPKETMVTISIYDMVGRNVRTLVNQTQSPGYYTTRWNATNDYGYSLSAGVYIYTINAGTYKKMKKMVVLK
jgi:hypothetical protein